MAVARHSMLQPTEHIITTVLVHNGRGRQGLFGLLMAFIILNVFIAIISKAYANLKCDHIGTGNGLTRAAFAPAPWPSEKGMLETKRGLPRGPVPLLRSLSDSPRGLLVSAQHRSPVRSRFETSWEKGSESETYFNLIRKLPQSGAAAAVIPEDSRHDSVGFADAAAKLEAGGVPSLGGDKAEERYSS
jgi:hypothetical protein